MSSEINFTEIDPSKLKDNMISRIEVAIQEPLYPGDERRIFAEGVCYGLAVFISSANEACKSRLLKYASGYALDAMGERVGCTRLAPIPAKTTLIFTLAAERHIATAIPAGTRCTADNTILFASDVSCSIPAGKLTVAVPATATAGGSDTNGIPAGTVQSFVDDVPFVAGVTNTTESAGGSDGEPYPEAIDEHHGDDGSGDDRYRDRIRLAPSGFSCAGTESAYAYHALSANANVADVKVLSDQSAGRVEIYIVERGGEDPSPEIIAEVKSAVTAENVKPLGDLVTVSAPEKVEYGIRLTYYCASYEEAESIKSIEGENGAIQQFIEWQCEKIGRDINPDKLRSLCLDSCSRLELSEPSFSNVSNSQIAKWDGKLEVTHIIVSE